MIVGNIGATVTRRPHPGGRKGAMMSLNEVASRAWAARADPLVRAWATQQLKACNWPTGRRDQARCIIRAFKKQVQYVEDPLQVEAMFGPRQTLCLDKGGLCVVGADCDDMTITLDAVMMSIGWRTWVVGASYRDPNVPTHVYGAFEDDLGAKVPFDATTDYDVGNVAPAVKEWWVDPSKGVSMDGLSGGEFVGVGRPGHTGALGGWGESALSFGGGTVGGFGLGIFTPGDVLLYRNMWDDYVLDTVRVCQSCSAEYTSLAQGEQNPAAKDAENALATSIGKMGDDLLAQWNVFAGKSDDFIVLNGATIVETFQNTVKSAGNVRASLEQNHCPMSFLAQDGSIQTPSPGPDTSLQLQIISRIEGVGVLAAGILEILVGTAEGTVQVVGKAADFAAQQAKGIAGALSTPWPWLLVATVVGGVLVWKYVPSRR